MIHLLDVSTLIAAVWQEHPHNAATCAWLEGRQVAVCPLSALGFLRISTLPGGPIAARMADTRTALAEFLAERKVRLVPDDLDPLASHPETSKQVTDCYLADLAQRHGLRLGTLDTGLKHLAADVIPAAK